MIKQVECRIVESRPVRPVSLSRPTRRILSIEKPSTHTDFTRYDEVRRQVRTDRIYGCTGKIVPTAGFGRRIDVLA